MSETSKIFSERLQLRKLQEIDIPDLIDAVNEKDISENILNIPYPYSAEDARLRLDFVNEGLKTKTRFIYIITNRKNGSLMGEIGIHLDINHG